MGRATGPGRGQDERPGRHGRALVLAAVLLGRAALGADPPPVAGTLSAREEADAITVTCRGDLAWKVVVDRTHGGVIRHFSIPDDGPNLVAEELKTDGTVNPFRGMLNVFYMTRVDQGATPDDRVKAKGTLWGKSNGTATIRVASRADDVVVVEAKGRGFGWRLLGPPDEAVVEYRQSYTFRPDRVTCDGELTWVYPHDTRLEEMSLNTFFAPDAVTYPLRVTGDDGRELPLPLTSSKGARLPDGVSYPCSFDVILKNGHRLRFRPSRLPGPLTSARWFNFERPWQQEGAQAFALVGDTEQADRRFPAGEPTRYRYEMQIARLAPGQAPPRLTITSPGRDGAHRPGETVRFSATATDGRGRPLPGDAIGWSLYYPFNRPVLQRTGAEMSHTIPANPDELKGEYLFAVATVADASGRTSQAVVKINVDVHAPPVGTESTFDWQAATPESQGMSGPKLEACWADLLARRTDALLVVRNDRIVFEKYADGWGPTRKHYTASMAKALVGGTATAVLLSDGRVTLDDRVAASLPAWKADPLKAKITLRQLGSHTSGLDDAEEGDLPHDKLDGWKGRFWRREAPPNDPFTLARDATPVVAEPGTRLGYSNPGIAMLGYALTYALTEVPQRDIRTLLRDRILRPIGVRDDEWSVGYGETVTLHGLPLVAAWGGGGFTPRAVARVARLMLREGDWDGVRLLGADAVRQVTRDVGTPGNGAIGWWTNDGAGHPSLPADAYWGHGAGDQIVLVVPNLALIVVRNGGPLDPAPDAGDAVEARLFAPLLKTLAAPAGDGGTDGPRR
jgi:CubicO group peptidase (beta-lactamase class C family)